MEVSWLGVELELHLPAFATATATPDRSCICTLHHRSWQCRILNPLSEARDQTCVPMDASQRMKKQGQDSTEGESTKAVSRSSRCGASETNPTRTREVGDSIPGLTQWVKDPLLP